MIKSPSIKQYVAVLITGTLFLFMGYGSYTEYKVRQLEQNISNNSKMVALEELKYIIESAYSEIEHHTQQIADWEEVSQQLSNPTFYAYWHNHRSMSAGYTPDYMNDLSIYDREGQSLGFIDNSLLPATISTEKSPAYFQMQQGALNLIVTLPVIESNGSKRLLGYVATRSDFLDKISVENSFQHIDSISFQNKTRSDAPYPLGELLNNLEFELNPDPNMALVLDEMKSAIFNLGLVLLLVTIMLYPMVAYLIARPLRQLNRHIDHLRESPESLTLASYGSRMPIAELEKVRLSLNEYHTQLYDAHGILDEKNQKLETMAYHDALTGALNRRAFDEQWRNIASIGGNRSLGICLAIFDLNHFKPINDTYGHEVGDQVLKIVAQLLTGSLRTGESLYRLGGDEFAAIFFNSDREVAETIASRCNESIISYPFIELGVQEPIRISIGLAHADGDEPELLKVLQWRADMAMYSAKQPGRSHIAFFTEEMESNSSKLLSNWVNNAVYESIKSGDGLEMHYQPIIDFESNNVSYYEALIRIRRDNEMITPNHIFKLVETHRLEVDMDRAILKQILHDLNSGVIPEGSGISINISGPSIIKPEIIEWLAPFIPFIGRYKLVIEVTETSLITQIEVASRHLNKLREAKFLVALDDFGSGYSSICYLANMPVDIVKFDISLIRGLNDDQQSAIVSHLATMIREAGYSLVAEGIESEEISEQVMEMGFNYGQGFLYGKPKLLN
ncbi:MAG: bifunctional diguanylate cyclase/phosphodiesterase [Gammaproteobacteria bacterium]|nr:bifunctional diguanylate cyclase/phosphodiesterase [Gammaproteobacteria bacterium]